MDLRKIAALERNLVQAGHTMYNRQSNSHFGLPTFIATKLDRLNNMIIQSSETVGRFADNAGKFNFGPPT